MVGCNRVGVDFGVLLSFVEFLGEFLDLVGGVWFLGFRTDLVSVGWMVLVSVELDGVLVAICGWRSVIFVFEECGFINGFGAMSEES